MNQAKAPSPPDAPSAGRSQNYPVNFTLTTAERVRALAGPPAWSVRLRRIERLEEELASALVAQAFRERAAPTALTPSLAYKLATLNGLVAAHNAYYPIEANLPSDPRTRSVMDRGHPWRPMAARRAEDLLAVARDRFVQTP